MKAVNDFIIVSKDKVTPKKVAGLIITEELDEDNRYIRGKVISAGNLTQGISDNDIIRYDKLAGHSVSWDNEMYDVIRQRDVIIIE